MREIPKLSDSILIMSLITFSGGLQDAYSYFVRGGVYANAQTGNIVLMAMNIFTGEFHQALRYLLPISAFLIGIGLTELICFKSGHLNGLSWQLKTLMIEVILLLVVAFLPINEEINPIANALTSLACAMQVQAFRQVNGHAYASTMCIGNMRSGMEALSDFLIEGNKKYLIKGLHYIFVIFVFFLGAGFGSFLSKTLMYGVGKIILISCLLLVVSFYLLLLENRRNRKWL